MNSRLTLASLLVATVTAIIGSGCSLTRTDPSAPELVTPEPQDAVTTSPAPHDSDDNSAIGNGGVDPEAHSGDSATATQSADIPALKDNTTSSNLSDQEGLQDIPSPLLIKTIRKTGQLQSPALTEVSGLAASQRTPGVLFAINDSGNSATLHALGESGEHLTSWPVDAKNRDWEELATTHVNGVAYLIIGDTGDNLRVHGKSRMHFIAEPDAARPSNKTLKPAMSIDFEFEDGPRNVEAFAVHDKQVYLISKEPIVNSAPSASRLYTFELPDQQPEKPLLARYVADRPLIPQNLQARLAASFAGVDLNHPTALDINASGTTAYLLTYRQVYRIDRASDESWSEALQHPGTPIYNHNLPQAEALSVSSGRAVFLTSEHVAADLWAIPVEAPL